ncbi:MAG: HtaA domain-containing protein [Corynebacterium sp.]|uniref:HtaA domain-containing protein n=1 Tax=Corynebacterium sp. TaxID=1720 RepID=UPI0026DC5AE3|nr:HtaA domain-containing protein [Corynebacterium sp.]MDO4762600.1 HtaA domain-containing protein [Corynebacterium sp.]
MKKFLTAATSALLVAGACIVPAGAQEATAPSDLEPTVTSGQFVWGFRKSLVSYITGPIGRGTVTLDNGVTPFEGDKKDFAFPIDVANARYEANGDAQLPLKGDIHFRAHYDSDEDRWGLDVKLSDFKLVFKGASATVTVDYETKGDLGAATGQGTTGTTGSKSGNDVELARFTLPKGPMVPTRAGYNYKNIDPTVAGPGFQEAFINNRYAEGTVLDAPDLTLAFNIPGDVDHYGTKSSVDSENRTKVIVGSLVGVFALFGAIVAALKALAPRLGLRLPF